MILTGIRFKVFITLMLALAVAGCSRDDGKLQNAGGHTADT